MCQRSMLPLQISRLYRRIAPFEYHRMLSLRFLYLFCHPLYQGGMGPSSALQMPLSFLLVT